MEIIYLTPKLHPLNGISQYASLLCSAMKKYAPEFVFRRVDDVEFEQCYRSLPKHSIIMAEMSVGEGKIFQALRRQKKQRPDLRRLITIHDPPRFAVEMTPLLEKMSAFTLTRALRRLFLDALDWTIERDMIQQCDIFVTLTPLGKQVLEEKFKRFFPFLPQVFYVPHLLYLDPPECAPAPTSSVPTLGYFGYINPHKGLHILIEAAYRLKKENKPCPRLIIYGESITRRGSLYLQRVQGLVQKYALTDSVQFRGYLDEPEIMAFLRSVDALAMPYSDLGFVSASGVLQWARSVGIPVLASKTRAFASLIADGVEGRIIPTHDIVGWAEAMHSIVLEHETWQRFRSGVIMQRADAEWKSVATRLSHILQAIQRT